LNYLTRDPYFEPREEALSSTLGRQLERIFDSMPYQALLEGVVRERTRASSPLGRLGYPLESLMNSVVASFYLGNKSTADIVRELEYNSDLALICGFNPSPEDDDLPQTDGIDRRKIPGENRNPNDCG
jgi:hypothetical protein